MALLMIATLLSGMTSAAPVAIGNATLAHPLPAAICYDYLIPVDVSVQGYEWIGPQWSNEYELIDYVATQSGRHPMDSSQLLEGNVTVGGQYEIGVTFCKPVDASKGKADHLLLASHGLWFDREYVH